MDKRIIALLSVIAFLSTAAVADHEIPDQPLPGTGFPLEVFNSAYRYARTNETYGGMGMSDEEARTWAANFVQGPNAQERLEAHEDAYRRARRNTTYGGFGMSSAQARDLADRLNSSYAPQGGLDRYSEAFAYARRNRSYGGLGLSDDEAREFGVPFGERADGAEALERYKNAYTLARRGSGYGGLGLDPGPAREFAASAAGVNNQHCNLAIARSETADWVRALKAQVAPARQLQVDHLFAQACMSGTLSPQLMAQQISPLIRAPGTGGLVPTLASTPTASCVSALDLASDHPLQTGVVVPLDPRTVEAVRSY